MKLRNDELATEIRDWTLDCQAQKRFWPFRAMTVCGILGALSMVSAIGFGVLMMTAGWPAFPIPIALLSGFVLLVLAGLFKTVIARRATIRCSKCRCPMAYWELNCPSDSHRLAHGSKYETMTMQQTIQGRNGRLYALYTDLRHKEKIRAARLMQGARVCRKCERFIVTEAMIFRELGSTRGDIEEAEEKARLAAPPG